MDSVALARRLVPIDPKTLAALAAHLSEEKKALDVRVYDVAERLKVADFFVVVTGQNRTHVRALFNELHVRLKAMGEVHKPVQGVDLGWWIVLDYLDVVVHLMQPDAREFYDLDRLYGDCPLLDLSTIELPSVPEVPAAPRAEV